MRIKPAAPTNPVGVNDPRTTTPGEVPSSKASSPHGNARSSRAHQHRHSLKTQRHSVQRQRQRQRIQRSLISNNPANTEQSDADMNPHPELTQRGPSEGITAESFDFQEDERGQPTPALVFHREPEKAQGSVHTPLRIQLGKERRHKHEEPAQKTSIPALLARLVRGNSSENRALGGGVTEVAWTASLLALEKPEDLPAVGSLTQVRRWLLENCVRPHDSHMSKSAALLLPLLMLHMARSRTATQRKRAKAKLKYLLATCETIPHGTAG